MDESHSRSPQQELNEDIVNRTNQLISILDSDLRIKNPFNCLGIGKQVIVFSLTHGIAARVYDERPIAENDREKYKELKADYFPVPNVISPIISGLHNHVFCVDEIKGQNWSTLPLEDRVIAYEQIIGILEQAIDIGWEPKEINLENNSVWDVIKKKIFILDIKQWKRVSETPEWIPQLIIYLGNIKTDLEKQLPLKP